MSILLNPEELKEKYISWLEDEITVNNINQYIEVKIKSFTITKAGVLSGCAKN